MRITNPSQSVSQSLTNLVTADGDTLGFIKDADRATDAEARAQTSTTAVLTPSNLAGRASFKVRLSADQTGIADATATKIAFNTEIFDVGAAYDNVTNYRWTPPAGKVALHLVTILSGTFALGNLVYSIIYKNGAVLANATPMYTTLANDARCSAFVLDSANGTDYYEAYCYIDTTASTGTVTNSGAGTYFEGWQI